MTILLVRHAEPVTVPEVAPTRWRLSAAGRTDARALGPRLPFDGVWVSSTETKAHETLSCAGAGRVEIRQDPGFDEVVRDEPFDDGYVARRLAWVEGRLDERHAGWEAPHEVADRFEQAVSTYAEAGTPLVVCSHGMAMTAWLRHARGRLSQEEAGPFWSSLGFPDLVRVD